MWRKVSVWILICTFVISFAIAGKIGNAEDDEEVEDLEDEVEALEEKLLKVPPV